MTQSPIPSAGSALIVDDDRAFAEIVELGLRIRFPALSVQLAESGEEAINRSVDTPPDLLFIDLEMPRMGGVETVVRMRELVPRHPVTVLMSGGGNLEAGAVACGADFVIAKPFVWPDFFALTQRGLELAGRLQAGPA